MYTHEDHVQPRDRRAWTDEEDEMLRAAIDQEDPEANPPSKWHAIAKHIPNRTNKDCRKRWWAQMATRVSKGSWSTEEDERLFSAVEELGTKWAAVAGRVGTRNSGQCAKRWNDALNPAIDRSGWTPDEDQALLKAVEAQGHSWANIARTYLPGRTGLAAKNRYNHLIRGSSDRSPSTRARRMSAATAMRRRNTRGSSTSSTSSPPSPRSTATPPPSSSSGASSPGSSGTPPTPEVYALQSPLDYRSKWNPLASDVSFFDDVPGLSHSGSTSRSSPAFSQATSPGMENQMLNMFLHGGHFSEFLDPSIDPSSLASLNPTPFSLDPCSPNSLLPDTVDPWSTVQFPYPDFNGTGGIHLEPPQLTPSMSSTGSSSVNSTPQIGQPHYTGLSPGFMSLQEPHIAYSQYHGLPDRTAMQYMHSQIDPTDPRVAAALAMCDPYDVNAMHSLQHAYGATQ